MKNSMNCRSNEVKMDSRQAELVKGGKACLVMAKIFGIPMQLEEIGLRHSRIKRHKMHG
jgi:hypothetical protein